MRVRAAHEESARPADRGVLVECGMLLLLPVVAMFAVSRPYASRLARRNRESLQAVRSPRRDSSWPPSGGSECTVVRVTVGPDELVASLIGTGPKRKLELVLTVHWGAQPALASRT